MKILDVSESPSSIQLTVLAFNCERKVLAPTMEKAIKMAMKIGDYYEREPEILVDVKRVQQEKLRDQLQPTLP